MPNIADNWGRGQGGEGRTKTVSAAVSAEERAQIRAALRQAGFPGPSQGVRFVLLSYAASARVRDAVAAESDARGLAA